VVEEMIRTGSQGWRNIGKGRQDVADLNRDTQEPPMQTFRTSPYVMEDSSRRVEFRHFGWAHTRGDAFVYLPKEKVLCTGDVVVNGPLNVTANANIANWARVIGTAQKLDVVHVLPGHGKPGGKELLSGQAQFLIELQSAVRASIQQGKKLGDLVTMSDGVPASTTLKLPPSVAHWVGAEFLATQVRDTYEEMTQGIPRGDLSLPVGNRMRRQKWWKEPR
jgi:glyoxylase-like metal-dependent hydrolase (beta-lactamase superfamily II)